MYHNRGSLLITAVFIIVIFSVLLAVMVRLVTNTRQVNVSEYYAIKAQNLAESANDFVLMMLFEAGSENSANSSLWVKLEPQVQKPIKNKSYELISCVGEQTGKEPFCNDTRCKVETAVVTPYNTGSQSDTIVVYNIKTTASCEVPWLENSTSEQVLTHRITRSVEVQATDIRWYNVETVGMSVSN